MQYPNDKIRFGSRTLCDKTEIMPQVSDCGSVFQEATKVQHAIVIVDDPLAAGQLNFP